MPTTEPCLSLRSELRCWGSVETLAAQAIFHRRDQAYQGELGVSQQSDLGLVRLVQIARVIGGVDDWDVRGKGWCRQGVLGEAATDAKDQVGLRVEEKAARTAEGVATRAESQGMIEVVPIGWTGTGVT
jgi:hypothetical protein